MADTRKSGKQVAARQRARDKAAQFREKQDKLEELATSFFVATDSIDEIQSGVEREIEAARKRGEKLSADARAKADDAIASMLALGVARNEVAGRLGIPTRDVKKPASAAPVEASGEGAAASSESEHQGGDTDSDYASVEQ